MFSALGRVRRLGVGAALSALLAASAAGPVLAADGPPPPSGSREVLRAVHTDALHVTYEAGELGLSTRIGSSGGTRVADPAGLVFNLEDLPSSRLAVPDDPAFGFLGNPGDTIYVAPEVQESDLIWPGWDTEELPAGAFRNDAVDLTLLNAEGPGNVEVFFSPDLNGNVPRAFSAVDETVRTRRQPVGAHVHANWAFTELGTYTLTFEASAVTTDGAALRSGPVDYTFVVGPYTPAGAGTSTALSVSPDSAHVGDEVTLSASVEPVEATGWVEFLDGTTSLGHEQVVDGQAVLRTTALAAGNHSSTARFTPVYSDDWAASTSPAVPFQVIGDGPPPPALSISGLASQYAPGDPVQLTAVQDPVSEFDNYQWFAKPPGGSEFEAIALATEATYGFQATEGLHGTQYLVRLYDENDTEVAASAPVTLTVTSAEPPCESLDAVLDVGHVDVAARLVDGALQIRVKDGTQPGQVAWRPLDKTAFIVKPQAEIAVPDNPAYDFLGEPGAPVWVLPQVQDPALLWPGWNTEAVNYSTLAGPVRWGLTGVDGPGKLAIYQNDGFGQPQVAFDSGAALPQHLDLAEPTHAHGNWAFTAGGIYRLTFSYTAKTKSGQELSASGTVPVAVGDVDLEQLCPGGEVPDPDPTPTPGPSPDPDNPDQPKPIPDDNDPPGNTPPGGGKSIQQKQCVPAATNPASSTGTSDPGTSTASTVLKSGHVDYAARLVDGKLTSQVKDGTVAGKTTWREPKHVVLNLLPASATQVPSGSAFAFLGSPGSRLWQIPQTQKAGILWLGWNTEELSASQVNGTVTWSLDKLEGPGPLAIFEFDSFGRPKVLLNSGDGLPDTYQIPLGTHAHGNWTFTKPGTYKATFTHSATLASGGRVSDTEVVTFTVGNTGAGAPVGSKTGYNNCSLAKTGASIRTPLLAGGALLGGGALLIALSAYAKRRRAA